MKEKLSSIPSVDRIMSEPQIKDLLKKLPREKVLEAIRHSIEKERESIKSGLNPGTKSEIKTRIIRDALTAALEECAPSLVRVVNATGIIVHTNLGRSILPAEAIRLVIEAACGYTNIEFDLKEGRRGSRLVHLKKYFRELTLAEDSLAVNNNAAAIMLILDTFAKGREVIVSRGEFIEIGGSFRLPEVLKKSGAILREVGCTNKTYLHDYEDAINENTAMILKIHKSNYDIIGFVHEVTSAEIAALGKKYNILTAEDLGSGLMTDLSQYNLYGEPTVKQVVKSGVDLITFSGDKMLGGPQAGIVVGRSDLIARMEKNPLHRALRLDKMTIAALEGMMALYREPDKLEEKLPFLKMLAYTPDQLRDRIEKFLEKLKVKQKNIAKFSIINGFSKVGGGAFPTTDIPTTLLAIEMPDHSPDTLYRKFLDNNPPVLGRIYNDKFVLDFRTVLPEEEEIIWRIL